MRRFLFLLLLAAPAAADSLDDLLGRAGFLRSDLGWEQRGRWAGFPRQIPHKLPHFDGLFREPLATVPFTRGMGRTLTDLLSTEGRATKGAQGAGALMRLVWALGVDKRMGTFRSYSANLTAVPTPLAEALLATYAYARRQTRFVTFNTESPYPTVEKDLRAAVAVVPEEAGRILGELVMNVLDARRWADLAWRNVPLELRTRIASRLDLGAESVDALEYEPAVDDVARLWDEASLWYAALKCVEALDVARGKLAALPPAPPFVLDWETPLGWIRVRGGGDDATACADTLLCVDLGGNDTYTGSPGASSPTRALGLCLDLSGDDTYRGDVSMGAGLCGVGVMLDGGGSDRYLGGEYVQGVGQFGLGALIDLGGDDVYEATYSAQGCGFFGIGLLLEGGGNDSYSIRADGQGFGGVAGVGVLADRYGNDRYRAEPDGPKSGRPSYHSEGRIAVSNAQGCAMGRRGDGADGHSWAGGLGALLDAEGNDSYLSGNWSMGTGYWFGTGILWEGGGDDVYDGYVWSQATGAHFCIGVLVDEAGADTHFGRQNNSVCFAHDFTIALLVDAAGDDHYETPGDGLGYSINRSVAMLLDLSGDDTYRAKSRPGFARYDERFADRTALMSYWVEARSLGLFLDLGGRDSYAPEDCEGLSWADGPDTPNAAVANMGVGADLPSGAVELGPAPREGSPRGSR